MVDRLTCDVLVTNDDTCLGDIVAQLIVNLELVAGSRTLYLSDGNLLTTHGQEELSHAHILAGIICRNLYLDGLLACCTIEYEGIILALHQLAPDGRRSEAPVLVGIEGEVQFVASCTCDSLYLWEHRGYGIVVIAGTSCEQGH